MNVSELHPLHKQLGSKIIECKNGKLNGYAINTYNHYNPETITLENSITRPDRVLSFDGAYDLLYGKPQAPDFTKVLA